MVLKSTLKITTRYNINEVIGDMCTATIIDLGSEREMENEGQKSYEYDCVEVFVVNNPSFIESHLDLLYERGKEKEGKLAIENPSIEDLMEALNLLTDIVLGGDE